MTNISDNYLMSALKNSWYLKSPVKKISAFTAMALDNKKLPLPPHQATR